jgi:hypothetical protein
MLFIEVELRSTVLRYRSNYFVFFLMINAKHLSIIQIVQSHFAQAGQRNEYYPSCTISHSVRALQWRLACTTSSVLYQRRLTNIRYHTCKRRVFHSSFYLYYSFQTAKSQGLGSDRHPFG